MNTAALLAFIKKQPIGVACAGLCLGCLLLLYFRSEALDERQKTFDARTAEADKIETNVRNAEGLPAQVAAMQADGKEMGSRLIRASQLALNYRYFYRLVDETGVKLIGDIRQGQVLAGKGTTKTSYQAVPYTVTIQCTYPQVLGFLQRLQSGAHFCRITSATFSKIGGDNSDRLSATLNLDVMGLP